LPVNILISNRPFFVRERGVYHFYSLSINSLAISSVLKKKLIRAVDDLIQDSHTLPNDLIPLQYEK